MKIYTKTGDDGNTGLQGDYRISKSHSRIMAYGTVDEANASIGIVLTNTLDDDIRQVLTQIQNELFLLGSDLSNQNLNDLKNRISLESVEKLEEIIDKFELELSPITNFILPGGNVAAAQIHQVRTIVRRAETLVVKLSDKDEINSNCIKYLNRLSDLMFVMGRLINKRNGVEDIIWKP
ncbi:MAG: cob(I)yrinic acid a,c-diamide adenosyltransferase [Nitrosopumilus sp.]|jgi:cob(I)alamin adenosyltransferase|nr:cob(I)yrinic acid a,c-diamide adenosyltransferase [Nitrosopumilus sp.]MDB4348624.1 cob(I)yrinic acid a,c-diamide adenosyltransferase [bacterium]MDC0523281.1 cob(I)yrinic acid a,c-diamide adenosyltransferase [Nitrosopumilus sp.]MDC0896671.1 cob(I)yrinic acid a,c-diamide adenosyltransferase [Nitrosopumilus sp.]MDC1103120.1 cob(I)yrinic acid a,c-diamide adenosyltransferase [Nitrosopumilus sp.]|tara:strand:- start:20 stop:556 length:537 start_codon:yes stop_codon:yes gene_type:complete